MKEREQLRKWQDELITHMKKHDCDAWLSAKQVLLKVLEKNAQLPETFEQEIKYSLPETNNLLTLLLLHSYKIKPTSAYSSYSSHYKQKFLTLTTPPGQCYQIINQWVDIQVGQARQQAVEMILEGLGGLLQKQLKQARQQDFQFLFEQFQKYVIKKEKEVNVMVKFVGKLQSIALADDERRGWPDRKEDINCKQIAIIKSICQVLADKPESSGNLSALFDDYLLGSLWQKHIKMFKFLHESYICNLTEDQLLNIFKSLTKLSMNLPVLYFLNFVSKFLVGEEEFYKLRHLYQNLILTDIARRAKSCLKPKIQDSVLAICEYYVVGFWSHCKIGKAGLDCLLTNLEEVTNRVNRNRWVGLCGLIVQKQENLRPYLETVLDEKKLTLEKDMIESVLEGKVNTIWEITTRSIRKHKAYKMNPSQLKGLINNGNQCYIISIVQALFMTKQLSALLNKVQDNYSVFGLSKPKNPPIISHLKKIFQELSNDSKGLPDVGYLKQDGPQEFAESQHQQDAQNYLIRLLEKLEQEFKQKNLLDQFKRIFQIEVRDSISCDNCTYKTDTTQLEYAHTISNCEEFALTHAETITDYNCPKCKMMKFTKRTLIILKSTIVIVHINRFSSRKGSTKKELPTQPIKRQIEGYELVGMVFHEGKGIEAGHYTYYSRVEKESWAYMNDRVVQQFNLSSSNQPFELQMKAEKTPYILFYKKARK